MDVARSNMDKVNYEDLSDSVREFCAQKYYELEKALRPMIDGSFGEPQSGHLAAYLATIRQLGKLYRVEAPPRTQDWVRATEVTAIVAGMRQQHELQLQAAVAEAEARIRAELSLGSQRSISAAKATVSTRLLELEKRAHG